MSSEGPTKQSAGWTIVAILGICLSPSLMLVVGAQSPERTMASTGHAHKIIATTGQVSATEQLGLQFGFKVGFQDKVISVQKGDKTTECSILKDGQAVFCSVEGQDAKKCSVKDNAGSKCSVLADRRDETPKCSVQGAQQLCSVLESEDAASKCSVILEKGEGFLACSILAGGENSRCSVVDSGNSICSVLMDDAFAPQCSVLLQSKKGNKCSVINQKGTCSIIVKEGRGMECSIVAGESNSFCSIVDSEQNNTQCSVMKSKVKDPEKQTPLMCSVSGIENSKCSIVVQRDPQCSVIETEQGPLRCSVKGGAKNECSVIQGREKFDKMECSVIKSNGDRHVCSIITVEQADSGIRCSLLKITDKYTCSIIDQKGGRDNKCSLLVEQGEEQQGGPDNQCSVIVRRAGKNGECSIIRAVKGEELHCSILGRGRQGAEKNFCSVVVEDGQKGHGRCSIIDTQNGAKKNACSIFDFKGGKCSVIGKDKGTAKCSVFKGEEHKEDCTRE